MKLISRPYGPKDFIGVPLSEFGIPDRKDKAWVAVIKGSDSRYQIKRTFLRRRRYPKKCEKMCDGKGEKLVISEWGECFDMGGVAVGDILEWETCFEDVRVRKYAIVEEFDRTKKRLLLRDIERNSDEFKAYLVESDLRRTVDKSGRNR